MRKKILRNLAGLLLPFAAYGAQASYGAYQRRSLTKTSGYSLPLSHPPRSAPAKVRAIVEADQLVTIPGTRTRELIVVDASVEDRHVILKQAKPGVDVVEIKAGEDGIPALVHALQGYTGLHAVHLVAHAEAGAMYLGGHKVEEQSLLDNVAVFAALNRALREGGDLLLYGCDLAQGKVGDDFLEILHQNTHVDVAASLDRTGNEAHGGNWELEIRKGDIEAALLPESIALQDFSGILAAANGTYGPFQAGWTNTGNTVTSSDFVIGAKDTNTGTVLNASIYNDVPFPLYIQTGPTSANNYFEVTADGVNTASFELTGLTSGEYLTGQFTNLRIVGIKPDNSTVTSSTVNGTAVAEENLNFGAGQLANFSGVKLKAFKLFYDTTSAVPGTVGFFEFRSFTIANAQGPSNNDGNVTAAAGVVEPVGLDTTKDTAGEAVNVFDVNISDGGASDGLPLTVSQIVLNVSGTSTDAERAKVTWRLNGPDVSNVAGVYSAVADTITFSGLNISVANGGNETYTVNAFYNDNTGLTDGRTFILSVDGDTNLTVGGGTQMGSTAAVTNGTGTTIDVVATELVFTNQPGGSVSGSQLNTQPVVTARDAFGNTDKDFTETVTLTEASAGLLTNNTKAAVAGIATFSGLTYTATADQQSFTLTANDVDGSGSNLPTADSNSVTSNVVATKLLFAAEPAPLTVQKGVLANFTTVPVVRAADANNITDTDYTTGITLVEVNGAGSATMSGTGDTDGNGATVTITPSSGVATFTGLSVTYTNSGSTAETFNLRASSGGLATPDSAQLTSEANIVPVVANLGGDSVPFTEGAAAVVLDASGNATVTDVDSADFNGGNVTVAIVTNRVTGEDVLGIVNEGTEAGQIGVSGANVSFGGANIGTFAGGTGTDNLVITFNSASATPAAAAALVRKITYLNSNTNNPSSDPRTVRFTVNDGDGGTSANADVSVTVAGVNDVPTVTNLPASRTFTEDTIANLDLSGTAFADVDSASITASLAAASGTFTYAADGNVPQAVLTGIVSSTMTITGAPATVNLYLDTPSNIFYQPAADVNGTVTLTIRANDHDGSGDLTLETVTLNITPVNDAPNITAGGTLPAVDEDTASPAGALLSSLGITVADPDASPSISGYAIVGNTANSGTQGTWQYATNNVDWFAIGTVADGATALVLSAATRVRFVPVAHFNGAPAGLTFRALDDTYAGGFSTTAGSETRITVDTTTNGDPTAISDNTGTIATTITSVNDAPVGTNNTVTTNEDTTYVFTAADFGFTDPNDTPPNALAAVKIASLPAAGTLTNDGAAMGAGDDIAVVDITGGKLGFAPAANANGAAHATITFQVRDAGGTANAGVDLDPSANTMTIDVTAVNDVPVFTAFGPFSVNETAGNGAAVGNVDANNGDGGAADTGLSYSIVGGTGQTLFAINSTTGAITVNATGASTLNYEAATSYTVTVRADDGGTSNNTTDQSVTINIGNVAPVVTASQTFAIDENSANATVVGSVAITGDTDDITWSILAGNTGGAFAINAITGQITVATTAALDFETTPSFELEVRASDGVTNSDETVTIDLNDDADAPVITSNGGGPTAAINVAEGVTAVTTVAATDEDDGDTVSFSLNGGADAALFNITSGGVLTFVTARDLETKTDANADGVYEVVVRATDSSTGSLTDDQAISVTITDVNDRPVLDETDSPVLATIAEDPGAPVDGTTTGSTLVSALVDIGGALGNVTDPDAGAVTGIAVTSVSAQGTLYYSTNGGADWTELTDAVSATSALLLNADANTRVYFLPNANVNTSATALNDAITFKAWDRTSGTNGGTADTTAGTAFSTATDTAAVTISAVADTPTVASPTINEDADSGAIAITRAAADGAEVTHYKITGITNGTLFSDSGFSSQIANGTFLASAGATTSVYFRPTANVFGTGAFTVQASVASNDGGFGGSTATSTVTVTSVNDAPTDIALTATAIAHADGVDATVGQLSATDVDDATFTFTLVAGTGDTNNASFEIDGSDLKVATGTGLLPQGTYSVRVQADDGDTAGTYAEVFSITVTDDVAPPAPSVPDLIAASDAGASNSDNITNDTTPTFSGAAEAGSTVKLFAGVTEIGSAIATGGTWTITPGTPAPAGTYAITATATDTATVPNTSVASGALSVTIDTTAPAVQTIARQSPETINTDASSVTWRVTFDGAITGLDAADFEVTRIGGDDASGTVDSVSLVSAGVYDVVVDTLSGQGGLRLDLKANGTGITDVAGNAIAGGFTDGDFYAVGIESVFQTTLLDDAGFETITTTDAAAQRFTTAASSPHTLTTVIASVGAVAGATPSVTIHEDDGGTVGDEVGELEGPSSLAADALNVWTGALLLEPNTTYWVVFSTGAGSYQIKHTANTTTTGGLGSWLNSPMDYEYLTGSLGSITSHDGVLHLAIGATSVPTITSSLTASATYGGPFNYQVTATNLPTSYSATGLPPGVNLNTTTGLISGTLGNTGSFNITLTATNGSGTSTPATLVVNGDVATLTAYADSVSRPFGAANPTFSISYTGFVGGDGVGQLSSLPVASTTATPSSPPGSYPITLSGGSSSYYTIDLVPGTLTVSKATQTIAFDDPGDLIIGDSTTLSATASSGLPVTFSLLSGPATLQGANLATNGVGTVTVRASQAGDANYSAAAVELSFSVTVSTPAQIPPLPVGGTGELTIANPNPNVEYQWQRDGSDLPNGGDPSLTIDNAQPSVAGLYSYTATVPGGGNGISRPVIVGIATTDKVVGTGEEVGPDILHPNGNTYDQVVLEGSGAAVTANPNQITRISFIDLQDDIVQVELCGAGTLSLVLDNAAPPAPPVAYNQPHVNYVKGHAGIVVTGADETTNVTIFSVGRATAANPALFRDDVAYDGTADIAYVAIQSANGKFGGLRTGNVSYFATRGFTGVFAPGVEFTGPLNFGNVSAFDRAMPLLVVGAVANANITGGDLFQPNGAAVDVAGLTQLRFVAGTTSHGETLPAQQNQGVLIEDAIDVTDEIVINP